MYFYIILAENPQKTKIPNHELPTDPAIHQLGNQINSPWKGTNSQLYAAANPVISQFARTKNEGQTDQQYISNQPHDSFTGHSPTRTKPNDFQKYIKNLYSSYKKRRQRTVNFHVGQKPQTQATHSVYKHTSGEAQDKSHTIDQHLQQ